MKTITHTELMDRYPRNQAPGNNSATASRLVEHVSQPLIESWECALNLNSVSMLIDCILDDYNEDQLHLTKVPHKNGSGDMEFYISVEVKA